MTPISFTKKELKEYPLLPKIEKGMRVLANDQSPYQGLEGVIRSISYQEKQTAENHPILWIVVDFEEPDYCSIEYAYPALKEANLERVFMTEKTLGFYFHPDVSIAQDAKGQIVCPDCYKGLDYVIETQYDDIQWDLRDGKYVKVNNLGSSDGKRCPYCSGHIDDSERILPY